ncbi:hypothetical protein SAY86_017997 [Trapa natans]|uniref:non-specific serine/threonine protein kinase n=1 Tax=Trapa natans TaxID=22666 RepID=A0AAN7LLE4_TRANT|nr:hypothetical protein SAY86_017997 [Trapa natans]
MQCFQFLHGSKRDYTWRTPKEAEDDDAMIIHKTNWDIDSSISTCVDGEVNQSEGQSSLQDVSDTSFESSSSARPSFPALSHMSSSLREFTVLDLRAATKNFSRSAMIGEGGFGCVYEGTIKDTDDSSKKLKVAVKQLNRRSTQGHKEWVTEVKLLGVAKHLNLVKLLGYCAEEDERGIQRLLVYEHMSNGSVHDQLWARHGKTLSWTRRLRIAQDTARGLAYLHEEMDFPIIFRDFKSSNILLDEQWNAKLSDFGLARVGPEEGLTHVSTTVVGTIGYAAPEYVHTGRLTSKNDVWSYGVFLYELITGRQPRDHNLPKNQQNLLKWVKPFVRDPKKFPLVIDPRLERKKTAESGYRLAAVANKCLVLQPKSRPKMSEVLKMVNEILEEPELAAEVGGESPLVSFASSGAAGKMKDHEQAAGFRSEVGNWCRKMWTGRAVKSS